MAYKYKIKEVSNPTDIISVDVPLFIRLLEYAREDAKTDMDLHDVAENIIKLSSSGKALTMDDYSHIVGPSKGEMNENIDDTIKKLEALIRKQFDVVEFKAPSKRPLSNEEFLMVKVNNDTYGGPQSGLGKFIKRWTGVEATFVDNQGTNKVYWVPLEKIESANIQEAEVGDVNVGSGIKSTVTNINPETGTVAWDIDYVPAYDTVFSDFTKLRKSIDQLAIKTKDSVVNDLTSNIKDLYNKYRTYLRKNQPDVYKKFGSVAEEGEGGMSVSNAAGGYLGKYAYRLPKKQKDLGEETEAPKPNAKDPGATLGAGPSASSKGVKNNAYVKQFGYKVVK